MLIRHVVFLCGSVKLALDSLTEIPDVEVYHVDGPDAEHEIEMALLNDLVRDLKLVFVGGNDARRFAELYRGTWIDDGPTSVEAVLRFWGISDSGAFGVTGAKR